LATKEERHEKNKIRLAAVISKIQGMRHRFSDPMELRILQSIEQDLLVIAIDEFSVEDLQKLIFKNGGQQ
jgi:hypothetical protein